MNKPLPEKYEALCEKHVERFPPNSTHRRTAKTSFAEGFHSRNETIERLVKALEQLTCEYDYSYSALTRELVRTSTHKVSCIKCEALEAYKLEMGE